MDLFLYQSADVTPVWPRMTHRALSSVPVWAKCPSPTSAKPWHLDRTGSHRAASYRPLGSDSWVWTRRHHVLLYSPFPALTEPHLSLIDRAHRQSSFLVSIFTWRNHSSAIVCFCSWLFGLNSMPASRMSLSPMATTWPWGGGLLFSRYLEVLSGKRPFVSCTTLIWTAHGASYISKLQHFAPICMDVALAK